MTATSWWACWAQPPTCTNGHAARPALRPPRAGAGRWWRRLPSTGRGRRWQPNEHNSLRLHRMELCWGTVAAVRDSVLASVGPAWWPWCVGGTARAAAALGQLQAAGSECAPAAVRDDGAWRAIGSDVRAQVQLSPRAAGRWTARPAWSPRPSWRLSSPELEPEPAPSWTRPRGRPPDVRAGD